MKLLRLAILCSDGPHHRYLRAALSARFAVQFVAIEPEVAQRKRLRLRKKWGDYVYRTYHGWRHRLLHARYRRKYFNFDVARPQSTSQHTEVVSSINELVVARCLREAQPDVVVVMGTSILDRATLAAAGPVVLNIHGGFLPDYRGNNCFFFALYHERLDRIGSTIHFVDCDVDRGDIVEVVVPPISRIDTPETLYCRAEKMAIGRLVSLLERYQEGVPFPRRAQENEGNLFRTRDRRIGHELFFWSRYWWRRVF